MRSIRISDWAEKYGYEYAEVLFAPEADEWAKVERWTGAFKPINDLLREWREKQLQPVVSD